jgi:hypothetical protein
VERIWATTPLEDIGGGTAAAAAADSTNNMAPSMATFGNNNNTNAGGGQQQQTSSIGGFAHSAFSQHLKEFELEKVGHSLGIGN